MPEQWTFTTWNTQGDFSHTKKTELFNQICGHGGNVALFIQEGGVNAEDKVSDWLIASGMGVGAFNNRCTNYILLHRNFVGAFPVTIMSRNGYAVVGGGEAGRTPAGFDLGRILLVSWHSYAGPSNTDTSYLLTKIDANENYYRKHDFVIIGGDFNASPQDIREMIASLQLKAKLKNFPYVTVCESKKPTHHGKKGDTELDFFVIMGKSEVLPKRKIKREWDTLPKPPASDHWAVQMTIEL